jgi:hypothetical protein
MNNTSNVNTNVPRVTLVIPKVTNRVLEDIQHHLRRRDDRPVYKTQVIHQALVQFAEQLGLPVHQDSGDSATTPTSESTG